MSRRQKTNSNNLSTLNTFNTPSFIMGRVGDAILDNHKICPGGEITGFIKIIGGQAEQKINKIDSICVRSKKRQNPGTY